jgi:hypothetical protein
MANQPERDDNPIMRRYSYEKVNEHVLLPQYYLSFPESGTPMEALVSIAKEMILTDECHTDDKVVTVNIYLMCLLKVRLRWQILQVQNSIV